MLSEPLEPDTVRVRWLSTGPDGQVHMPRWRDLLDADELARADKFLFAPDRDTFILAHALTRAMLSRATGQPVETWHYVKGQYGKPALAPDCAGCGLRFNISHTRGFAVCAIARDEIGVDVEASDRRIDFRIADRYFAPEEVAVVRAAPSERTATVFFRFWTLKEAFIKATGEGLRRPLASFSFAFDPLRISFHPERDDRPRRDDPATWQFIECRPAPDRPLALAVNRAGSRLLRLDARAALAEEIAIR
jgi:4'-phosphopantetheinyl transferase